MSAKLVEGTKKVPYVHLVPLAQGTEFGEIDEVLIYILHRHTLYCHSYTRMR